MYPSSAIRGGKTFIPGSSSVPMPSIADLVSAWGLFNLNNAGASGWEGVTVTNQDATQPTASFTTTTPYPINWSQITGTPPYDIDNLWDQQGQNHNLEQTGTNRPVLNAVDQRIDFTAASEQYLANADMGIAFNDVAFTFYAVISTTNLAVAQLFFQYGYDTSYLTQINRFAAYLTAAGNVVVTQNTADTIPVFNSKTVALPAANTFYLLSGVFDRANGTAANQTIIRLNNSAAGVSNVSTSSMNGNAFNDGLSFAIGAGQPLGTAIYLNGSVKGLAFFNTAHSSGTLTSWAQYLCQSSVYNIAI